MTDLIDRQAAIDALRYAQHRFTVADEAGGMGIVKWSEDVIYFAAAEKVLDEMPTIDAEPIIRCKDCKQYQEWMSGNVCLHRVTCSYRDPSPNGYCSYAERKDDEA